MEMLLEVKMDNILEVIGLKKYFPVKKGILSKEKSYNKAVDGVSFSIKRGEFFGLVGESGCGKTTLARCILKLIEPDDGKILLDGIDITKLSHRELFPYRKKVQVVFQDPNTSLNPRKTIFDILSEGILLHKIVKTKKEAIDYTYNLLESVGISKSSIYKYPHEFSGGQKQRIAIARAISLNPELVICDEAISSLDVSIQGQILKLLIDLKERYNLSYLFIAHDLAVVKSVSDRIAVMYAGKIVELTSSEELFTNPLHPYTKLLISSIPEPDPEKRIKLKEIKDEIEFITSQGGCNFYNLCKEKKERCSVEKPELIEVKKDHFLRCFI
jgi:oligopeptide/dipeptide ABC transporter ATP-binding protein